MELKEVLEGLTKRGFKAMIAKDGKEAVELGLKLIPSDATVGFGGSETVKQLGFHKALLARGNTVFHRELPTDLSPESIMNAAYGADWFVASANALTSSGVIMNTDGRSNRVASTIYGSKNTLLIVGKNKIVGSVLDGIVRISKVAAPLNCKRLNINNPCVTGGSCNDCPPSTTICRTTVVQKFPPSGRNYCVILVDEDLGF